MKYENQFELATREKFRFPFRGLCTVEDLWDLSLTNLDSIYKTLNADMKTAQEESLLQQRSSADVLLDRKIEIIKYIVAVKQQEAAAALEAQNKKAQKQQLLEIKSHKQHEKLMNMSEEELDQALAAL